MKYFVFADPHGNYEAMLSALSQMGYEKDNKNHQLIGLGDYFGRAAQGKLDCVNIYKYLKSDEHANQPICLHGNHESILINAIRRRMLTDTDIYNGEHNTFASFAGVYPNQIKYDCERQFEAAKIMINCGFLDWMENLPWYFETEHYIFVHGFLPISKKQGDFVTDNFEQYDDEDWNGASWAKTPDMIKYFENYDKPRRIVVFGHWRAKQLREMFLQEHDEADGEIYIDNNRGLIGLDCTTVLSDKVGCVVLED